jgi:hypothetical protein
LFWTHLVRTGHGGDRAHDLSSLPDAKAALFSRPTGWQRRDIGSDGDGRMEPAMLFVEVLLVTTFLLLAAIAIDEARAALRHRAR